MCSLLQAGRHPHDFTRLESGGRPQMSRPSPSLRDLVCAKICLYQFCSVTFLADVVITIDANSFFSFWQKEGCRNINEKDTLYALHNTNFNNFMHTNCKLIMHFKYPRCIYAHNHS